MAVELKMVAKTEDGGQHPCYKTDFSFAKS